MKTERLHPLIAAGFTLLLAGFIAHAATHDWLWTAGGVACLLASAVWANAFTSASDHDESKRDEPR